MQKISALCYTIFFLAMMCVSNFAYANTPGEIPDYTLLADVSCADYYDDPLNPLDPNQNLGPVHVQPGIATAFVTCISKTIRKLTYGPDIDVIAGHHKTLISALSDGMKGTVQALSVLFIAMHGIRVLGRDEGLKASTISMLIRLGLVNFFFFNLGSPGPTSEVCIIEPTSIACTGLAPVPFRIMDELSGIVAKDYSTADPAAVAIGIQRYGPFTPWGELDLLIGLIFGIDPGNGQTMTVYNYANDHSSTMSIGAKNNTMANGMLALFGIAAFSGAPGMMLALAGVLAFLELLMFAFDIIYVYLLAELLLALCVMLSPVMVPLGLFKYTNRYFQKWINTMVGAMLIPAFLFGFLWLTIDLLCQPISDALMYLNPAQYYDEHGNPWYEPYARKNQAGISWSQGVSSSFSNQIGKIVNPSGGSIPNTPAVGQFMDSKGSTKSLANSSLLGTVDQLGWGLNLVGPSNSDPALDRSNPDKNISRAMLSLIALWIYSSVLIGMIKRIPGIAQEIAGARATIGFQMRQGPQIMGQLQSKFKQGGGGGSFIQGMAGGPSGGGASSGSASEGTRSAINSLMEDRA